MKNEKIGRYVAIVAVLLLLVLPIGLASTAFSMYSDFQAISLFETKETQVTSDERSIGSMLTILGVGLIVPGIALLIISIAGLRYRTRWIFWFSIMVSGFAIFIFPIGTFLTAALLTTLFLTRNKSSSAETVSH
ncbi:hypothetical protein [Alkalimonas mucilaginosa]|uniref:DUF4064 domain-containing protein n=1 Tax=Alkalimonas mucilaginosa TaxID=3057676 RepID=A0ABU7JL55_9GAMM|nr:hypothetical protein [Alkalimonas sp. MEB004]MEE2026088.1 hypothetical protein [Alkalimonas sp. MEB004]